MNAVDFFTYQYKLNSLKNEMELIVAKQEELNTAVKKVYQELAALSDFKCTEFLSPDGQKFYHEAGNPDSQTPFENIGDGG